MRKKQRVNIFQGNKVIRDCIAETWGLPQDDWGLLKTTEIFFPAFFYLSKRFGQPKIYDDYKDAGIWDIEHKDFTVRVYLNSSFVEVMIFGNAKRFNGYSSRKPYWVRFFREVKRKKSKYIDFFDDLESKTSAKNRAKLFQKFCKQEGITSQDRADVLGRTTEYQDKWEKYVDDYRQNLIGVDHKSFIETYGHIYQNRHTRHALRVLRTVLKSLLAPIYIRDVAYNIKGRLSDDEAFMLARKYGDIVLG